MHSWFLMLALASTGSAGVMLDSHGQPEVFQDQKTCETVLSFQKDRATAMHMIEDKDYKLECVQSEELENEVKINKRTVWI